MLNPKLEKRESKAERTDRIALGIIRAERASRDRKTARIRDMRLKIERLATG